MNLIKAGQFESFTTSSTRATDDMKSAAEVYKTAGLEELMRVNDSGKNIKILVKSGLQILRLKNFDVYEGGSKSKLLMSLTGNFDLNEISILTDKMRIPGGDDLKKATKEKII
jgi:hypothetical protein